MNKGFYILLLFAAMLTFEACKNNDNVFPTVTYAYVNVVNASADTLNYYLNGTRQNDNSSLFPDGQTYYTPPIPTGNQNIQFKKAGAFNVLFSYPIKLDTLDYSLYVTGETAATAFSTVDYIDTSGTSNGVAFFRMRFVNASPSVGTLTVLVDSTTYPASAFKSSSSFLLYGSGPKEVKIFQAATSSATIDTTIIFQPGHAYTLYSKGSLTGKGNAAFDVGVATNF
jgi:hypothetical protein